MIKQFVDDINDFIRDAQQLKRFVSGPIINLPLNESQVARLNGTVHALTGIKDHYIELSKDVVSIVPDGNGNLNVYYPGGDYSTGLNIEEIQAGIQRYYSNKGQLK